MSVPDPATTSWVPLAAGAGAGGGVDYKGTYSAAIAYVAGDVVLYNGVNYLAVNPSTGQTPGSAAGSSFIGTSLPASPIDGQEFILVDSLTAPTYQWRFRYVASITGAYKWIFIGGAPSYNEVAAEQAATAASYSDCATVGPDFTIPRAGDYLITCACRLFPSTPDNAIKMSYAVGAIAASDNWAIWNFNRGSTSGAAWTQERTVKHLAIPAGALIRAKYLTTVGFFSHRVIRVLPARVS